MLCNETSLNLESLLLLASPSLPDQRAGGSVRERDLVQRYSADEGRFVYEISARVVPMVMVDVAREIKLSAQYTSRVSSGTDGFTCTCGCEAAPLSRSNLRSEIVWWVGGTSRRSTRRRWNDVSNGRSTDSGATYMLPRRTEFTVTPSGYSQGRMSPGTCEQCGEYPYLCLAWEGQIATAQRSQR